jgi:hypothetical protein
MFLANSAYNREEWAQNQIGLITCWPLAVLWFIARKIKDAPKAPDPWDDEIAAALNDENAAPLCIHCLRPYRAHDDFCVRCGAPVGDLTNYMPSAYYVSPGYVLRIGANDNFKRTPGSIVFFLLAAFRGGIFFVPFYWLRVLINLGRPKESRPPDTDTQA